MSRRSQSKFVCPFCGGNGKRTREHVWAQWLHQTVGAQLLLDKTHGERIPRPGTVMQRDSAGRFHLVHADLGTYSKYLPHVTVSVCETCNTGWMSKLEEEVKRSIGPLILQGDGPVKLAEEDLGNIAAWAIKCWMAYAVSRPDQGNPFTLAEYRGMASNQRALQRAHVWLLYASGPYSYVGIGLDTMLISGVDPPDLESENDNAAFGYIAMNGVIVFLVLEPEEFVGRYADISTPPQLRKGGARRIWPSPRKQYLPIETWPPSRLSCLLEYPTVWRERIGLPTEGLTDGEVASVARQFFDGEDPAHLRLAWAQEGGRPS